MNELSKVVNAQLQQAAENLVRNRLMSDEFLGANIKGKTVIIIDEMISSGESMLDTAKELKDRGAKNVVVCCTFGLFTDGLEKFDDFNSQGYFDYVITTNLNYRSPELLREAGTLKLT